MTNLHRFSTFNIPKLVKKFSNYLAPASDIFFIAIFHSTLSEKRWTSAEAPDINILNLRTLYLLLIGTVNGVFEKN